MKRAELTETMKKKEAMKDNRTFFDIQRQILRRADPLCTSPDVGVSAKQCKYFLCIYGDGFAFLVNDPDKNDALLSQDHQIMRKKS